MDIVVVDIVDMDIMDNLEVWDIDLYYRIRQRVAFYIMIIARIRIFFGRSY